MNRLRSCKSYPAHLVQGQLPQTKTSLPLAASPALPSIAPTVALKMTLRLSSKAKQGVPQTHRVTKTAFPSWEEAPSTLSSSATVGTSASGTPKAPSFSWSSQGPTSPAATVGSQESSFRTVTPDLARFGALAPSSTQYSQPLQPTLTTKPTSPSFQATQQSTSSFNWSTAPAATSNPWASSATSNDASSYSNYSGSTGVNTTMSNMSLGQTRQAPSGGSSHNNPSFSLPPPPGGISVPSHKFWHQTTSSSTISE